MKQEYTTPELIALLLKEKSELSISMIMPLATLSPEREQNNLRIKKALQQVQAQLEHEFANQHPAAYLKKISNLLEKLDPVHTPMGFGLYISAQHEYIQFFPFTPIEKIIIGPHFEIRDLLLLKQMERSYFVLELTETNANILEGSIRELQEIKPHSLKIKIDNSYEYAKPSRSTSYAGASHVKSFERDEEIVQQEKLGQIFKKIDQTIQTLHSDKRPLFVIASNRLFALFRNHSSYSPDLLKHIEKDPAYLSMNDKEELCWSAMQDFINKENKAVFQLLKESVGLGLSRLGVQECWRATQEGNCRILLVEKDFHQPGFITNDPYYLFLTSPRSSHRILADAVDELMQTVIEKGGEILLLENGDLTLENRIGLITRY